MLVPMTANQGIAFTVDDGTLDGLLYQIYPVFVFDPSAHNAGRTDTFALYAVDPVSFDGGGIGTVSFGVDLVTPIPGALPLFATGLAGLAWLARRRRKPTA
jgi:hypothetical protein